VIALAGAAAVVFGGVNIGTVVQAVRTIDSMATKEYVVEMLEEHVAEAELSMTGLSDELKRIRAFTEVVPELRNLLTLQCMGTPNLGPSIDRLKREFARLTSEQFEEPPCEQLLARAI